MNKISPCAHCGHDVEEFPTAHGTAWAHRVGDRSYLNRCQSPEVPYGMEAHPEGTPCPTWCLGSRQQ